ncbi:hypothetical protein [Nocardia sp. NPDC004711]
MTVIADTMVDIGHGPDVGAVYFRVPVLRDAAAHTQIVTPQWISAPISSDGTFTSPDLEPGPAQVRIGGIAYEIVVPVSPTPIRLWPLIDAGVPAVADREFVRDGGGVRRIQALPQSQFDAMPTGRDVDTIYITFPG